MHRKIILILVSILYYVLSAYGLFIFDAGLLVTALFLFAVPAYFLAKFSRAPSIVVLAIVALGLGIAILLEGIAHLYGLWYTIGESTTRLFGLIPIEMILALTAEVLFLGLLYEAMFDDGQYSRYSARVRFGALAVFVGGVTLLVGLHQYLIGGAFLTYSFVWILGIMVMTSFAALSIHRVYSVHFLDRLVDFTLVASIPLLIALGLAITNTHKVFANMNEYVLTLTIFGEMVPLEEVLLALALPFLVATMYELYLDDRA